MPEVPRGTMLSRRGLHRLRYQRRHLQKTYAFSELDGIISDQHATLELIGGLLMSSDEGLLPGCFQRAVSASWLTSKSAMLAATTTSSTLCDGRRTQHAELLVSLSSGRRARQGGDEEQS